MSLKLLGKRTWLLIRLRKGNNTGGSNYDDDNDEESNDESGIRGMFSHKSTFSKSRK